MTKIECTVDMSRVIGYRVCDITVTKRTFKSSVSDDVEYSTSLLHIKFRDGSKVISLDLRRDDAIALATELLIKSREKTG